MNMKLMIQQGYVPETCTLQDSVGGALIWSEINASRDPCAGCNMNRAECHGRPKQRELQDPGPVPQERNPVMPTEEAQKVALALAATAAAQAPGLRVRRTIPGGVGTITEGAIAKRNADALLRADSLKVKITDLQIEIDSFKNKRDRITTALCGEKDQLVADLEVLKQGLTDTETQQEARQNEISRLRSKADLVEQEMARITQSVALLMGRTIATQGGIAANERHILWAATQDQPKIDQLSGKRDKLITRLYHLQNLHPALSSAEKESTGNG